MPPALFLVALFLQLFDHFVLPVARIFNWPWNLAGGVFIVAGLWITVQADQQFKKVKTPVHPLQTPSVLVTDGVFSLTRNPMYLGMVVVLVGTAILLGSLSPFAIPPLFAWLVAIQFIPREEAALSQKFGATYEEYRRRVRRWL